MTTLHRVLFATLLAAQIGSPLTAAEGDKPTPLPVAEIKRDKPVDFAEVKKILAKNCLACHSGSKAESSLVLESPESMRKGGDSGPALVPKKGEASLLFQVAAHRQDPVMPPPDNKVNAAPLTPEELAVLKLWIDEGAAGQATTPPPALVWQAVPTTVNPILATAMSADGQFAACGRANEIYVYNVGSGRLAARLIDPSLSAQGASRGGVAHLDMVQSLAFSPAGDLLASGGFREVKLWRRPRNVRSAELSGAAEPATAFAVSPDGKWAAAGEPSGAIRVWKLENGQIVHNLSGHTAAVTGVRFAADGSRLFSSSKDKTVRAWKVADGAADGQIATPAEVNGLALVNEAKELVTAEGDNVLRVWPLPAVPAPAEGVKPLKELKGHGGAVTAVDAVWPGGKIIVSGSADGSVRLWNWDNAQQIRQMDHGGGPLVTVAISADGKRVASSGASANAKIWNAENGQPIAELKGDIQDRFLVGKLERELNLSRSKAADRKREITEAEQLAKKEAEALPKATEAKAAADKALAEKTENLKKPTEAKQAADKELADAQAAAKLAADEFAKAKEAADKEPANADLAKGRDEAQKKSNEAAEKVKQGEKKVEEAQKPLKQAEQEQKAAQVAAESAQRNLDASQKASQKAAEAVPLAKQAADQADAAVKQAEGALEAGKKKATEGEKPIRALAFSADGASLATGGENQVVQVWNTEDGAPLDQMVGLGGPVTAAAFAPNGSLWTAAANKSVVCWNVTPDWVLERTIGKVDDPGVFADRVISLEFNADGTRLLTGGGEPSRSGELKLWNVSDGALIKSWTDPHSDTIFAARFSPGGDKIATSAADRFVKIWTSADGKFERALEGHTHHVLGVAWRLDGKILASCSADNTIKLWDPASGEQKRTIAGSSKEITSIAFLGDSPRAIASFGDSVVRLYNSDSGGNEKNYGGAADFVYSAAASADGKWVVGGGQDGVLRVWNADNQQVVRTFDPAKPK